MTFNHFSEQLFTKLIQHKAEVMLCGDYGILMSFLWFVELFIGLNDSTVVVKKMIQSFFTQTVKPVTDSFPFYCPVIYEMAA